MTELKDRAREYLAEHSEYSEVFRQTFIAVDTLTAMVEFAGQETKKLLDELNYAKTHCLFHSDCPTQKENAELKSACDKIQELLDKQIEATYKLDVENAELKKENAELKECNKMLEQGYVWHDYDAGEDCYEDTHEGKWVKRDEVYQLTKAKELIENLLYYVKQCTCERSNYAEIEKDIKEAEQFIKE